MKTLNQTVVSFVSSNTEAAPTIQEYFNGMIEGLSSQEVLVGSYYSSLTHAGKGLFDRLFESVSQEVVYISKRIKTRSVKLRKQVSAVAKRHRKAKKVGRASTPIFKVNLVDKIQLEANL